MYIPLAPPLEKKIVFMDGMNIAGLILIPTHRFRRYFNFNQIMNYERILVTTRLGIPTLFVFHQIAIM